MSEAFEKPPVNMAAQVLRAVLVITAMLMLVGFLAMAGINAMARPDRPVTADTIVLSFGLVLAGLFCAVVLLGLSTVIGMMASGSANHGSPAAENMRPALERLEQSLRTLNTIQSRTDAARQPAASDAAHHSAVDQLRDLTLMSEDQRQRYAASHWARRKQAHLSAIEREVLVGDWGSAFGRLEEMQIVMADDPDMAAMRERVESEQVARLEEDLRVARARLRHLMGSAMWQQAEDLATSVQARYPAKPEAGMLIEEVRRERDAWERDNMDRLFRDIAAASERRQWRHAVLAVDEFIRRYPLDPRAEALRLDLPTLMENAASQERKEQEEHFKDLLKRQRYDEAAMVARAVMRKYPQSPTAAELNKLLPRVEEAARQEAARVAAASGAEAVGAGA